MLSRRQVVTTLLASPLLIACGQLVPATPTPSPAPAKAETLRFAGTSKALPLVQKLADAYRKDNPRTNINIESGVDTTRSLYAIGVGQLDLTIISRAPKGDEVNDRVLYRPFVRDAVVFAVNTSSALKNVTTDQVREIYMGKLTDWQQMGEKSGIIAVLDREEGDSSRDEMLLKLLKAKPGARTLVYESAKDMLKALDTTPGAIGYSHLGLLKLQEPKNVRVLALDGVIPTSETMAKSTYPWVQTFGLAYLKSAPASLDRFLGFAYGKGGREIIDQYGYGLVDGEAK